MDSILAALNPLFICSLIYYLLIDISRYSALQSFRKRKIVFIFIFRLLYIVKLYFFWFVYETLNPTRNG